MGFEKSKQLFESYCRYITWSAKEEYRAIWKGLKDISSLCEKTLGLVCDKERYLRQTYETLFCEKSKVTFAEFYAYLESESY